MRAQVAGVNVEHIVAIALLGMGGAMLVLTGHAEAGAVLFGAIGGYAFKNGATHANSAPAPAGGS
jgi:hypothetical protein